MSHTKYRHRDSLTVTTAPKPKRGRLAGRRSVESLEAAIRALPDGVARLKALRQQAMDNIRWTDDDYKAQLRAVLEGGGN